MTTIILLGECPNCGCTDIRNRVWFLECYKCGYKEGIDVDVKKGMKCWDAKSTTTEKSG